MVSKGFLIITALLLLYHSASGQKNCKCDFSDKDKFDSYLDDSNYDSALLVIQKLNNADPICKSRYYRYRGYIYNNKNNYDSALFYYDKELALLLSACDSSSIIPVLIDQGRCLAIKTQHEDALKKILLALNLTEKHNDTINTAEAYSFVVYLFNILGQTDKVLHYCNLMKPYLNVLKASSQKADRYHGLAANYLRVYQDTKEQQYFDSFKLYIKSGRAVAIEINDRHSLVRSYTQLSTAAFYEKDFSTALTFLDSAKAISNANIDLISLYTINGDIADIFMRQKRYSIAKQYADSCLFYAKKIKSYNKIMNAYALIYQCNNRTENYKEALAALTKYIKIKDSVETVKKVEKINALEEKYNRVKNEKTIKELNQEKEIANLKIRFLTGGILSAVLIIAATFLYYRQRILKKKNEYLEIEQRLNRARLNPHLFFNSLTAIQGHALREKDITSVATYLSKQANIMRITLESTYKELVSIEDEVDFLTQYLDTQKLLYKDTFEYNIVISDDVDTSNVALPAMIIQPFVENAIEHGFTEIDYTGKIDLTFDINEEGLKVVLKDNGKGFTGIKTDKEYPSRATQIIKDRLLLLNQQYRAKAYYTVNSSSEIHGTLVIVQLPLIHINESTGNR